MGGSTAGVEGEFWIIAALVAAVSAGIAYAIVRSPVRGPAIVGGVLIFVGLLTFFAESLDDVTVFEFVAAISAMGSGAVLCGIAGAVRAFRPASSETESKRQSEDIY